MIQDFALVPHKTALFNVMLPMYFDKTPHKLMKPMALESLDQMEISHLANKKVSVLSGGEKQRVAIARAIVKKPKVILADEPTGALDAATGKSVMEALMDLNHRGVTLLIVTHDKDVASYCDRQIVLGDGQVKHDRKNYAIKTE